MQIQTDRPNKCEPLLIEHIRGSVNISIFVFFLYHNAYSAGRFSYAALASRNDWSSPNLLPWLFMNHNYTYVIHISHSWNRSTEFVGFAVASVFRQLIVKRGVIGWIRFCWCYCHDGGIFSQIFVQKDDILYRRELHKHRAHRRVPCEQRREGNGIMHTHVAQHIYTHLAWLVEWFLLLLAITQSEYVCLQMDYYYCYSTRNVCNDRVSKLKMHIHFESAATQLLGAMTH